MWLADFTAIHLLIKSIQGKSEMKYVGVIVQVRLAIYNLMCLGSEDMIIKNHTSNMRYLSASFPGVNLMVIYIGIYHSIITRDLLTEQKSRSIF